MRSESDIRTKNAGLQHSHMLCGSLRFEEIHRQGTYRFNSEAWPSAEAWRWARTAQVFLYASDSLPSYWEKKKNWTCLNGAHKIYTPMCRASSFIGREVVVTLVQCSVSDLASSRRRSPALRWVKPNCLTMLEHWVPLPLPGPPAQISSDHACGKYYARYI
jgi:hypothetical protein